MYTLNKRQRNVWCIVLCFPYHKKLWCFNAPISQLWSRLQTPLWRDFGTWGHIENWELNSWHDLTRDKMASMLVKCSSLQTKKGIDSNSYQLKRMLQSSWFKKKKKTTGNTCGSYPLSKKILFAAESTIAERHNWSKCKEQLTLCCPVPTDTATTESLHWRFWGHWEREGGKILKVRRPKSLLCVSSIYVRDAVSMKSQECSCQSKTYRMLTPVNSPTSLGATPLHEEFQAIDDYWKRET